MSRFILAALVALAAVSLHGCGMSSPCGERVVYSSASPGGQHNAILLTRRCRGEASPVTHVNLFDIYAAPSAEGDGMVKAGEVFAVEGAHRLGLEWKGAQELRIVCTGCGASRVSRKEGSWKDVRITYEERER